MGRYGHLEGAKAGLIIRFRPVLSDSGKNARK